MSLKQLNFNDVEVYETNCIVMSHGFEHTFDFWRKVEVFNRNMQGNNLSWVHMVFE
jgi:hypothetical protein